jgi:hypothetical protein
MDVGDAVSSSRQYHASGSAVVNGVDRQITPDNFLPFLADVASDAATKESQGPQAIQD